MKRYIIFELHDVNVELPTKSGDYDVINESSSHEYAWNLQYSEIHKAFNAFDLQDEPIFAIKPLYWLDNQTIVSSESNVDKLTRLLEEAFGTVNNDLPTVDAIAEYLDEHGVTALNLKE